DNYEVFKPENAIPFGSFYYNLVTGKSEAEFIEAIPDDKLKEGATEIARCIGSWRDKQTKRFDSENFDVEKLLAQIFPEVEVSDILKFDKRYHLASYSRGIFVIHISEELLNKIKKVTGDELTQAMAATHKDIVQFLMIPDYGEEETNRLEEPPLLAHEACHLITREIMWQGQITTDYDDPVWQTAFLTFREELTCRIVGSQSLVGYIHIRNITPEEIEKIGAEKVEEVKNQTGDTNTLLGEINRLTRKKWKNNQDLILSVFQSLNFNDLRRRLWGYKLYLDTLPISKKNENY
ncbi:MAG: hypothetical protein Athens101428_558, partial [Candidatus Berkelbacteria bacterium Athens1014_28]